MIYEELLVTPCAIPALPGRAPAVFIDPKGQYAQEGLYPCTRILEVSKAIYAEANPVVYSKNKFTTLSVRETAELVDYEIAYEAALRKEGVQGSKLRERWARELQRMRASTLGPGSRQIPKSLYTPCYVSLRLMSEGPSPEPTSTRPAAFTGTISGWDGGEQAVFDLVIIGSSDSGHINILEIALTERLGCTQLKYYTEVLRQHMPSLRVLTIHKRF